MKKFIYSVLGSVLIACQLNSQIQVEANGVGGYGNAYLTKALGKMYYYAASETNSLSFNIFSHDGISSAPVATLCNISQSFSIDYLYEANGKLYFVFNLNGNSLGHEPYVSDGTSAGTILLKDINPGSSGSGSSPWFIASNNKVFFSANNGTTGTELFVTDGTPTGTQLVKDIYPGSTSSQVNQVVSFNNEVWFRALSNTTSGYHLYKSDGTSAGTSQFVYPATLTGPVYDLYVHNNFLYFRANNAIWRTDGTTAGTIKIFQQSANVAAFGIFNSIGNTLFGITYDPQTWPYIYSLYSIDAVTLDTNLIKTGVNIVSAQAGNGWIVNNKLVFLGSTTANGAEPWITDGTTAGTTLLADINPGTASSNIYRSAGVVNNILYLNTQQHGIWKTDGTAAGTQSLGITIDNNYFNSFIEYNNDIYFFKETSSTNGRKLFKLGLNSTTGINENNYKNSVSVYPNPSNGCFKIESDVYENYSIKVYDMLGQQLSSYTAYPEETVDLRHLAKGIYTLRIVNKYNSVTNKKIILDK